MYTLKPTTQFKKDLKKIQKRGYNLQLLSDVLNELIQGHELAEKYRDHGLTGKYQGTRECHIQPDWLLIYEIDNNDLYLYLTRTGSHSDLFQ